MLGHIGVDDQTVRRRVPETKRLVSLYLPEDLPAARGAWDVLVHGAVDSRHDCTALRAQLSSTPHPSSVPKLRSVGPLLAQLESHAEARRELERELPRIHANEGTGSQRPEASPCG